MVNKNIIKKYCHMAVDNIRYEGITDVDLFNRPFETDMLDDKFFVKELCSNIVKAIAAGKLSD